jgi:hypothetical protein
MTEQSGSKEGTMRTQRVPRTFSRLTVPSLAVASALVLGGCGDDGEAETEVTADVTATAEETTPATDETTATTDATGPGTTPAPEDIDDFTAGVIQDPEAFVGQTITASATVDEVISEFLFTIAATQDPHQSLLVLHDGSTDVQEGDDVTVDGEVRQSLEIDEAEAFVGQDVDDTLIGTYEGDVYIQAQSVEQASS